MKILNLFFFNFSEEDIALVIKYQFSNETESAYLPSPPKRRKLLSDKIFEYAQIKLPASIFLKYLENYSNIFIAECQR
jgi:hypothetical protein